MNACPYRTGERSAHEPLQPTAGVEQEGLSLSTKQYLILADETGRHWHHGKLGRISSDAQAILDDLKIEPKQWDDQVRGCGKRNITAMGAIERLIEFAADTGRKWIAGYSLARRAYFRAIRT